MGDPFMMEDDTIRDNQSKQTQELIITYSDIANKLLKDRFLLTALELHSELIESGREIPKLKEFFSNPGNFENQTTRQDFSPIPRSSSQATLDSLDMTRYSEDGERGVDERVAVLEFELRKAKETISALRANLTVATECETPTTDGRSGFKTAPCDPIKPHEQRALNFLINEYLLIHGYKLTSITFADENRDQDFEDWDDVRLNIPKPAELLQLYRDAMKHPNSCVNEDSCTQTDDFVTELDQSIKDQLHLLSIENEELKQRISKLEKEKTELTASLERLTAVEPVHSHFAMPAGANGGETVSAHSVTPECFEMIESSQAPTSRHQSESGGSVGDRAGTAGDDTSSLNDTDWTRVNAFNDSETGSGGGDAFREERLDPAGAESYNTSVDILANSSTSNRHLPATFQREVLSRCFVNITRLNDAPLLHEILSEGILQQKLVTILAHSLPRIIPNVILNKREEIIPLLVYATHLHSEPTERETLLHWLFNLKKKPQEEERRCILAGVVSLAKVSTQAVIESELLPQCWEQLSHRHVERRLLVAEACSALAPYISSCLRNSLILSILQQLLVEDREEAVRLSSVKSLALIVAIMSDLDKYPQTEELTMIALQDSASVVVQTATNTLLPVLAKWTLDTGRLQTHLLPKLLSVLSSFLKRGSESTTVSSLGRPTSLDQATLIMLALRSLLPYLVMSVATVECVLERLQPGLPLAEPRPGFADLCRGLTNPADFYEGEHSVGAVMGAFDAFIKEDLEWPELKWVLSTLIPGVLSSLELVDISHEDLLVSYINFFKSLNAGFGKTVAREKVKPIFVEQLQKLELDLANIGNQWPSFAIIPVYLLAVLAPLQSETAEVGNTLRRFLCSLALSGAPLDSIEISVAYLSKIPPMHEVLMSALWEGVVHPRPVVRSSTAGLFKYAVSSVGESMTTNRIVPALITLASDPEISVRTATIPVFGTLIENSTNKEVEDKTYFQLQSFLSDPVARDNHPTLLQLVITLGHIVPKCDSWFRDEVVVPQLAAMAAYTLQLTNQTRKLDLAAALVDAFSTTVYCSISKNTVTTALLPGLRYLEQICSQSLVVHHETVFSMIREVESRFEIPKPTMERSSSSLTLSAATANVGQGMEDMKNRVTKIFQGPISRPSNLPNLQNIFRKSK